MKLKSIWIYIIGLTMVNIQPAFGQAVLVPIENTVSFRFSGLWNFDVMITSPGYTNYFVEVTLSEHGGDKLFVVESERMNLEQGSYSFSSTQVETLKPFRFTYLNRIFSEYIGANDLLFPDGNYLITYKVFATGSSNTVSELYATETTKSVFNYVSVQLLSVPDNDTIFEKNPFFIWTPIESNFINSGDGDGSARFTYSIRVCKILPGQQKEQALLTNEPVFEKGDITVSNQLYPIEATILEDNSSYVWQVSAYRQGNLAAKSELWVFHYSNEKRKRLGQYVWMNRNMDQAECTVKDGQLFFAYDENYTGEDSDEIIQGEIYTEWGQKVTELKTLNIPRKPGTNMVVLDLCGQDLLLANGNYTLIVFNGKNEKLFLNFSNQTASCNE